MKYFFRQLAFTPVLSLCLPRFVVYFLAALCLSVLPLSAFAAQTPVDINTDFGASAYGNSSDGGRTYDNSRPDDNTLNINSGGRADPMAHGADIYGYGSISASGNTVNVNSGGTVNGLAIGASVTSYDDAATASNNSAHVAAGGTVVWGVTGGTSQASGSGTATASGNTVTIGGTVGANATIHGGSAMGAGGATASGNAVTINSGAIVNSNSNIEGGHASSATTATASNNSVTINGGTVNANVTGGTAWSLGGAATGNTITIGGGTVGGNIYGGSTSEGSATGNTVTITTTGATYQNIYGGATDYITLGDLFTGNTLNLAAGNTVRSVHNMATLNFTSGGNASIGTLDTTATGASGNPLVTINTNANAVNLGGAVTGTGGIDKTGSGTLTLSGTNTYSGSTLVTSGTLAGNIAAHTNLTVASGATYDGTGAARTVNGLSGNGDIINGNGLTAQSGSFSGVISGAGGLTKTGAGILILSGANTYTGMTEVRGGSLTLNASLASNLLTLYGGTNFYVSGGTHSLNNGALHVHGTANYTGNLSAQNALLNFYVPTSMVNDDTMLAVIGTADISGSTVNVGIEGGSSQLQVNDTIKLISSSGALTGAPVNTTANGRGMQGVSLLYEFDILADTAANQLLATVTSAGINPQTKALSEGRAGGMAFVNQGADMAAGQGIISALAATGGTDSTARQDAASTQSKTPWTGSLAGFGAVSGGSNRYNTGSHVDVDGFSLMTGLGWRAPLPQNSLLLGVFFEAGWGSYDSHNSFSNAASVKGNGDTSYYGGGILARYDLTNGQLAGLYTEASLRVGYASTDFSSKDFGQTGGTSASYDSSAAYYGAHAGLGYVWLLNDAASLDFSTKYLWTHQNSDSVTVAGDPVSFKSSDSQRWRNGARFNYALSTNSRAQFAPYVGAAWEYEFDGEAKATTHGLNIDSPSLKGGTGMGELGMSFKPAAGSGFSAELGVQGYTGVREGVTGSLQLKYEF